MLTKETALARLRASGTLASSTNAPNTITVAATANSMVRATERAIDGNRRATGARALAPSACQAVLP